MEEINIPISTTKLRADHRSQSGRLECLDEVVEYCLSIPSKLKHKSKFHKVNRTYKSQESSETDKIHKASSLGYSNNNNY